VPAVTGRETSGAIKVRAGRCSKENTVAAPATARMIAATTIREGVGATICIEGARYAAPRIAANIAKRLILLC
jgi:hypothetical protein